MLCASQLELEQFLGHYDSVDQIKQKEQNNVKRLPRSNNKAQDPGLAKLATDINDFTSKT